MVRVLVCASLLLSACGSSNGGSPKARDAAGANSVAAQNYGRTCESVSDCVPVYEGVLSCCSTQPCPNAAIRQDKIATYMSDVAARTPMCTAPITPFDCHPEPPCDSGRVGCTNGVCTLESPRDGATAD